MTEPEPFAITLDVDLPERSDLHVQLTLTPAAVAPAAVQDPHLPALQKPWAAYPKPERGSSINRPADDIGFTEFWAHAWQLLQTRDTGPVHEALGVESMKAWVAQGRTLKTALYALQALRSGQTLSEALAGLEPQE